MYYIRWRGTPAISDSRYLIAKEASYPWGPLIQALSFVSVREAKSFIDAPGTRHWLDLIDVVFIHPLNFTSRCSRGI